VNKIYEQFQSSKYFANNEEQKQDFKKMDEQLIGAAYESDQSVGSFDEVGDPNRKKIDLSSIKQSNSNASKPNEPGFPPGMLSAQKLSSVTVAQKQGNTKPNLQPTLVKNKSLFADKPVSKFQSSGIGGLGGLTNKEDKDLFGDPADDLVQSKAPPTPLMGSKNPNQNKP